MAMSRKHGKSLKFCQKLQMSYWMHGGQVLRNNITLTSVNASKFLNKPFKQGFGFNALNTASSSLAVFLELDLLSRGKHPLVRTKFVGSL